MAWWLLYLPCWHTITFNPPPSMLNICFLYCTGLWGTCYYDIITLLQCTSVLLFLLFYRDHISIFLSWSWLWRSNIKHDGTYKTSFGGYYDSANYFLLIVVYMLISSYIFSKYDVLHTYLWSIETFFIVILIVYHMFHILLIKYLHTIYKLILSSCMISLLLSWKWKVDQC